LAMPTSELINF